MTYQSHEDMELEAEKELNAVLNESQKYSNVDIDQLLNDKAKKNQLTKINVKNLIRNVLTNDDVATMLRQTLDDDGEANCLYEPKLTRAKIREILKNYPPSVQWSPNQQESIISECRLLIEKEFPDDSEDEEYRPDKILEDEDEDDFENETKCKGTVMNTLFKTEDDVKYDADITENTTTANLNNKETIGMRTRSKFPLNDTPLEIIEQAFIPPDITEDMYDSACENDEWMEFLSEFTKPLEPVQNDDVEDDPEYNVLCDDDFTNVDKEEFRIDKSVKVTRKEYNDLMNELYEFTESYIRFNDIETTENNSAITENDNNKNVEKQKICSPPVPIDSNCSIHDVQTTEINNYVTQLENQLNVSQLINSELSDQIEVMPVGTYVLNFIPPEQNVENNHIINNNDFVITNQVPECEVSNIQVMGITPKQTVLLKQQLAIHVQLVTQSYLLCSMTKVFKKYCQKLKNMLEIIKDISNEKTFDPININASLKFIEDWTEIGFRAIENIAITLIPNSVMEFMLFFDEPLFIFPKMLPTKLYHFNKKPSPLGPSEERFLVLKIDEIFKKLKESARTRAQYRNKNLSDLLPMIIKTVHRRWFSHRKLSDLKNYVTRRTKSTETNILKNYLVHGIIDQIIHEVHVELLYKTKYLYEYDTKCFPAFWRTFVYKTVLQKT